MVLPIVLMLFGLLLAAIALGVATLHLNDFEKRMRAFCDELVRRYQTTGRKSP